MTDKVFLVPGLPISKGNKPSAEKARKIAEDLARLQAEPTVKITAGNTYVPAFQRQGYLEKLGHNRAKWFKRFFVLRDSFLLSYNLQKSDFTTEPRSCIHLGGCKYEASNEAISEREFCLTIQTETGDQFIFSASSEEERQAWLDDIAVARNITHSQMIKLAVENKCLAEEKGVGAVTRDASTSALAIFSNENYIRHTPLTGGMEGWLSSPGFNPEGAAEWKRSYFILRDSHIMMFNAGDVLSKPRGVMYLVGTEVTELPPLDQAPHRFTVRSVWCGDMIELSASSEKTMKRWVQALMIGGRVTFPDYRLLEKERQVLAQVVLTPRAPTPRGPGGAPQFRENVPSVLDEEVDILGLPLPPGAVQPYDKDGVPLIRNPDGQLINPYTQEVLAHTAPRFSNQGEQLDAFNRPLPPGAVPMFTEWGAPIGVGPDGNHYTADGELIDKYSPHFDANGNQLSQEQVNAAELIAPTISVAIKVQSALKGDNSVNETLDAFGRSFKSVGDDKLVTADGQEVPATARRVEVEGKLVTYEEAAKQQEAAPAVEEPQGGVLNILIEKGFGEDELLGTVEVEAHTTLQDLRHNIKNDLNVNRFVFLTNGVPLSKMEERFKIALSYGPDLHIRGDELSSEAAPPKFTNKVAKLAAEQVEKEKEQEEFLNILAKVREKKFLNPVGRDLTR